jgi:hypothetical protein
MVEILEMATVHSVEEGAVLAMDLGTDEVQPTDVIEPIMETVNAPTLMISNQKPKEEVARNNIDSE